MRFRPTIAEVDLAAVRHNVQALRPPGVAYMAVVKADAYGHGAVPVARAAVEAGADWFGVALVEEGVRLREAGMAIPVLVLTEFPKGAEKDALAAGLTPTTYTDGGLDRIAAAAEALGLERVGVHVKVDTGMHRVGILPDAVQGFLRRTTERGLVVEGILTHLAKAEAPDDPVTREQMSSFIDLLERLRGAGIHPRIRHAANTAATMTIPESRLDLVRVGIGTYGLFPDSSLDGAADLRPAMSLRSRVSMVKRLRRGQAVSYGFTHRLSRDAIIATVPVGYADGYARALGNRARVLIRGRRYPVVGNVTMDQLMVECGDDTVEPGDEVVLFGHQGDEEIRVEEVAAWWSTIPYEVVCAVSERVPREYLDR